MIKRWMSDGELTIRSEWRVGSPIVMQGNLHDIAFENRGTIHVFEPGRILQYDYWSTLSRSRLADLPQNYSMVRFELAPTDGATLLALMLSNFADGSIYQQANFYWDSALRALKRICEQS